MSANVYTGEDVENINKQYIPDDDTEIIRYMDFSKFMNMITSKKLYFTKVTEFEDKYEGKMPEGFFKNWKEDSIKSYKGLMKVTDEKRNAYASCWNDFEKTESYALWRIYTRPDSGVAIKSSVGRLKKSLSDKNISIYKAKYIESYENRNEDIEIPFQMIGNSFTRVKQVCKLSAYAYENEIRAIMFDEKSQHGMNIQIDLNELIESIYISPYAGSWFFDLVKDTLKIKEYGISEKKIMKSNILV